MSVFDSPNTARLDWRLVPIILVLGAGLVAWGKTTAGQAQIESRVTKLEERDAATQAANIRVIERLARIETRLDEVKGLLGGRAGMGR